MRASFSEALNDITHAVTRNCARLRVCRLSMGATSRELTERISAIVEKCRGGRVRNVNSDVPAKRFERRNGQEGCWSYPRERAGELKLYRDTRIGETRQFVARVNLPPRSR